MRIIAGAFKGRKLLTPESDAIRPTSDRTRESVFNLLMHGNYAGEAILGQHVVDVCCGTGALGLEALSRGARIATFIDQDKKSLELAKKNALHCGTMNAAFFVQADAAKMPAAKEPASLVLLDPPYATPLLAPAYAALQRGGWLRPGTLLVSEQQRGTPIPMLDGAELVDERQYGKAHIVIYRVG